jgi:hypothetical protein
MLKQKIARINLTGNSHIITDSDAPFDIYKNDLTTLLGTSDFQEFFGLRDFKKKFSMNIILAKSVAVPYGFVYPNGHIELTFMEYLITGNVNYLLELPNRNQVKTHDKLYDKAWYLIPNKHG